MIKKLLKMIEENPDLEAKFMICGDEVCDDFTYTYQKITNILISPWIKYEREGYGDYVIFTDYDGFLEQIVEIDEKYETYKQAEKAYPIESFKKVIVVYLGAV